MSKATRHRRIVPFLGLLALLLFGLNFHPYLARQLSEQHAVRCTAQEPHRPTWLQAETPSLFELPLLKRRPPHVRLPGAVENAPAGVWEPEQ